MRKPSDTRPDQDLQAIQTSVAFKHIADALEQYRRHFGFAFLALVAISAVHVGLVVIANLYTLETRVSHGVLVASGSANAQSSTPTPVATASAQFTYDIPYVMSNLPVEGRKKMLTNLKSVDFVDNNGEYRQYTVTGFKLGGWQSSELKLYTAVGHVLTYVRGRGFTVSDAQESCNSTAAKAAPAPRTRKLLTSLVTSSSNINGAQLSSSLQNLLANNGGVSESVVCADAAMTTFQNQVHVCWSPLDNEYNFSGQYCTGLLEDTQVAVAQCFVAGGMSYADAAAEQRAVQLATMDLYIQNLENDVGTSAFLASGGNEACLQGVRALSDLAPGTAIATNYYGNEYAHASCPILSAEAMEMYFQVSGNNVAHLQNVNGVEMELDSDGNIVWSHAGQDTNPIGANLVPSGTCVDDFSIANMDYLKLLSTQGRFGEWVSLNFQDAEEFMTRVSDALLNAAESVTSGSWKDYQGDYYGDCGNAAECCAQEAWMDHFKQNTWYCHPGSWSHILHENPAECFGAHCGEIVPPFCPGVSPMVGAGDTATCAATCAAAFDPNGAHDALDVALAGVADADQISHYNDAVLHWKTWFLDSAHRRIFSDLPDLVPEYQMTSTFLQQPANLASDCANLCNTMCGGSLVGATGACMTDSDSQTACQAYYSTSTGGPKTTPLQVILEAFGLTRVNYKTSEVVVQQPVNLADLTNEQHHAMELARVIIDDLKYQISATVQSELTGCLQANAERAAIAQVPVINGLRAIMATEAYETAQAAKLIADTTAAMEQQDTQLNKCDAAGIHLWLCYKGPISDNGVLQTCLADEWDHAGGAHVCSRIENEVTARLDNGATKITKDNVAEVLNRVGTMEIHEDSWGCPSTPGMPQTYSVALVLASVVQQTFDHWDGCHNGYMLHQSFLAADDSWNDYLLNNIHYLNLDAAVTADSESFLSQYNGKYQANTQAIINAEITGLLNGAFAFHADALYDIQTGLQTDNNWDQGKIWDTSNFDASAGLSEAETMYKQDLYGCTTEPIYALQEASSNINLLAYDACNYDLDNHEHRRPYFTGTYFSMIMGAFDSFAMYLPPRYCNQYNAYVHSGHEYWIAEPHFPTVTNAIGGSVTPVIDYVVMLHGWGGSSSFLFTSASVMDYAWRGHSETGASFVACQDHDSLVAQAGACHALAFPGGFVVLAPDGNAGPLGGKTWWMNSEFAGFVLDYIVFDLPHYMTFNLGMGARSFSMFGFSMGAFGTLAAVTAYTGSIATIYAAAAPISPPACFFDYPCHNICATDVVYCELLFTSFGQVLNSYIILWEDSLVVSKGSLDPVSTGVAVHMHHNGAAEGDFLHCVYHRLNEKTLAATQDHVQWVNRHKSHNLFDQSEEVFIGNTVGDYQAHGVASAVADGGCTHQDWDSSEGVTNCGTPSHTVGGPVQGTVSSSIHVSLSGIDTRTGHFSCPSACDFSFLNYNLNGVTYYEFGDADIWHSSSNANLETDSCFAFSCPTLTWCAEYNKAEGAGAYVDPVKSIVAAMKFVPYSNPVHDTVVNSAHWHFLQAMPLVKFLDWASDGSDANTFMTHPTIMYIHCSQNDDMELFAAHVQFASLLLYAASGAGAVTLHEEGVFVFDFHDCDHHYFTEDDLKDVIDWFSDSLHTFVENAESVAQGVNLEDHLWDKMVQISWKAHLATQVKAPALCWMHQRWMKESGQTGAHPTSIGGVASSIYSGALTNGAFVSIEAIHANACEVGAHIWGYLAWAMATQPFENQFTIEEWQGVEASNEAEMDDYILAASNNCGSFQVGLSLETGNAITNGQALIQEQTGPSGFASLCGL
eukprot:CAMPEP_0197843418 /NCGR_PEP_ID=MMETSP1438-20131217/295_1 /TAXON_ID=1461541 /ORGANISM="Pterosperma sp., Strain CCMP1384" /LENGTH=1807 /DNA_ID=CAMNT_0043453551 /DNA_START=52 /DNA_END=5475 /DNA_ORIENTATION=-